MDVVTLGAALSIMKKMPDTAASSAAAAEDAADRAEEAARTLTVDDTLSVEGRAADAKAVRDKITALKDDLVPYPELPDSKYGTAGQLLRTKGNGKTEWVDEGLPTDEQTAEAVTAWLNDHPEATTTVQNGSLTYKKLVTGTLGFVTPEMFGAVGDNSTDDSTAFNNALATGLPVVLDASKTYKLTAIRAENSTNVIIVGNGATIHAIPSDDEIGILFLFKNCENVSLKSLNVYSDPIYASYITGSDHSVPTGSLSSNVTFCECWSCKSIIIDDVILTDMYRFFTTWRNKDESNNDILNEYVELTNIRSSGWIRSDVYLAYVKTVIVRNYITTPSTMCMFGVHVFYIASSYDSKLITDNVIVNGITKSDDGTTGNISGAYHMAGNSPNVQTSDDNVRMNVYASNSIIKGCYAAVLNENFEGYAYFYNCQFLDNTMVLNNQFKLTNAPTIRFDGCTIRATGFLVETVYASYASTVVEVINCVVELLATTIISGNYTPNLKIFNSVLTLKYAITTKPINQTFKLIGNTIYRGYRGNLIQASASTGNVYVSGNHIEAYGGDTQINTPNATLVVANNIVKWLDSTPNLCSSNAIEQNNLIITP